MLGVARRNPEITMTLILLDLGYIAIFILVIWLIAPRVGDPS
jgi:hypothetical protein